MRLKIAIVGILLVQQLVAQSYNKIHLHPIMVDMQNDFLSKTTDYGYIFDADLRGKTHSDWSRLKQGAVDL